MQSGVLGGVKVIVKRNQLTEAQQDSLVHG